MEGPTPVSALIHAATMVTAGVYLIARSNVLFTADPQTGMWVAWVGILTAFFAATIALVVTDLKRILAYSTVSQLGYMFAAVGAGAYTSGIFHLITHAFFKALLFLAAGSVMHALHGELDIRKMGNLRAKMPTTHWTFLIGAAALAGIPFLSGFFSKDQILYYDFEKAPGMWIVGLVTALMTAIYAFRAVFMVFWGKERDRKLFEHAHESPRIMTVPLILLAIGSVFAGYLGMPVLNPIEKWLEPVLGPLPTAASIGGPYLEWVLLGISGIVALAGVYFAYRAYLVDTSLPERFRNALGWTFGVVEHKYYVDEAYNAVVVNPLRMMGDWFARVVDKLGIDGAVNGLGNLTIWFGAQARKLQTGFVGIYALAILFGVVGLLAWLVIR
jgi:NADH-quinone oxidoreductase subunit L